jgi:hypothetical protein
VGSLLNPCLSALFALVGYRDENLLVMLFTDKGVILTVA